VKARLSKFRARLEGLTPEEVALLLTTGLVLGVFPIAGFPTLLCLLAALGFRLNVAALQAINSITSPLQLALLLPLERAGALLCGGQTGGTAAGRLAMTAMHAVAGWGLICVPAGVLVYVTVLTMLRSRLKAA
jgi:hypothetical protein